MNVILLLILLKLACEIESDESIIYLGDLYIILFKNKEIIIYDYKISYY